MAKGLVSGIAFDKTTLNKESRIVLVFDEERKPLNSYGLPTGEVEEKETLMEAMAREWEEEAGYGPVVLQETASLPRGDGGNKYNHYFFIVNPPRKEDQLKKDGIPGETGPPTWVSLTDIFSGKIKIHFSHLQGLVNTLKKMAKQSADAAFLLSDLARIMEEAAKKNKGLDSMFKKLDI